MKTTIKILSIIWIMTLTNYCFSQTPEGINYQATVRNNLGALMTNQLVAVEFSIREDSATGNIIYRENHSVTTNNFGGFNTIIGKGIPSLGNFSLINWGLHSHFLSVKVNGNDLGTTQLMSVPYALYAKTSGSSTPGPQGPKGDSGMQGAQGPIGLTGAQGPTGATGAQGLQGLTGATGSQGMPGNTGAIGPQGTQGTAGIQGLTGPTGPQGLKGDSGVRGPQGFQGNNGAIGPQGIQGLRGATGPKGDSGQRGPQGLPGQTGIQGPQGNIGLTGPQGARGLTGLNGPKGDSGATGQQGPMGLQGIPGTHGLKGDSGQRGPQGLKGNTGAIGPQGPQGIAGIQGLTGIQGSIGPKGDSGERGPQGIKGDAGGAAGPQGPAGPKGDTGARGIDGIQGPQGARGLQGIAGIQGPIGPKGDTGERGPQGIQGIAGAQGSQGIIGLTGPQGLRGLTGTAGPKGDSGMRGLQGIQGLTGMKGDQGIQGIQGPIGLTGPKGDSGALGPQGIAGSQGLQGNIGLTGPKGDTGVQGPQGPAASDNQNIDSVTLNGTILTVYINNGTSANVDLSQIQSFEQNNSDIRNTGGYDSLNFIIGSPQMNYDGNSNHRSRMFFNKEKSAFRVGHNSNPDWDRDSLGKYSFASGYNSKAIGWYSTSLGFLTTASGEISTAIGNGTTATGYSSFAMGQHTKSSGAISVAIGNGTEASGFGSVSMGEYSVASGQYSVAMGRNSQSNGYASTVVGIYNDTLISKQFSVNDSTPLFIVGNGQNNLNRSNALTVYKSGEVEINDAYTLPTSDGGANQVLSTDGSGNLTWEDDNTGVFEQNGFDIRNTVNHGLLNFIVGSPQMDHDGNFRHNGRMFFKKGKAAFRAGYSNNMNWDKDSLGDYSFASGYNTKASGIYSTAMGSYAIATGSSSTAFGQDTEATGSSSTAMGYFTDAVGDNSTAMGRSSKAIGAISTAMGRSTKSHGYASLAIGVYNDTIVSPQTNISNTTPLLIVGNGSFGNLSNALAVYKSGKVEINDAYSLPTSDGSVNQVLSTDGSGNVTWENTAAEVFEYNNGNIRTAGGYDTLNFVIGSPQLDYNGNVNHRKRMFFNKEKGAFRVGQCNNSNWNLDSLGTYSFATGSNSKATGDYSNSLGQNTIASGNYSSAMGYNSSSSGFGSTALGYSNSALGKYSTAMGRSNIANGYATFTVGMFNDIVVPVQTGYTNATPLFIVGNGSNSSNRSNAMVVLKNGNIGIGTDSPQKKLHVIGKIGLGNTATLEEGGLYTIITNSNIRPNLDNILDLGSSTKRWDDIYATNGVIQTSDTTLKTNITPLSYGLNELMKIETISYQWKEDKFGTTKIGFNAQNLQSIIPEVVIDEEEIVDEETGEITIVKTDKLGVHYSDMIPVLTKSIQEQQEIIKNQKAENQKQVEKNEIQENEIKAQSEELEKLKKEMVEMKKLLLELMKSTHKIEK